MVKGTLVNCACTASGFPKAAQLVRVEKDSRVVAQSHSDAWLRRELTNLRDFPVQVVVARPQNTQVAEQGWRVLNRYRHTLQYLHPKVFRVVLNRLLHLLNKQIWGGVPHQVARAVPWRR